MLFNLNPGSSLATIFFPRQDKLTQYINIFFVNVMYYCSMLPLLIQVYKWAPLAYGMGKTPRWTDIPFRVGGGRKKALAYVHICSQKSKVGPLTLNRSFNS